MLGISSSQLTNSIFFRGEVNPCREVINGAKRIRRPHWTLEQWSDQQFAALEPCQL